jgi:hypothetical protein
VPSGLTLIQEGIIKGADRASNYIGSLTIANNALITHMPGHTNGVQLRVAGTLDIQPGAIIDVSSNGFTGGNAYRGWNCQTRGADGGATTSGASTGTSGGSYGSLGASPDGTANRLYGSESAPVDLGSGGSYGGGEAYGGNGGGRVDLEAGELIVNGSILANGGYGSWGGGGSGGSIWLRVANGGFQGSGLIQAQGGSPYGGGAGGGGRIAIAGYTNNAFAGTLGRAGTIFLQPAGTTGQLILDTTILDIGAGDSKTFDSINTTTNGACYLTNRGVLVMAQDTLTVPSGLTLIQEGIIKGANRSSNYIGTLTVAANAVITHLLSHTNGVQLRVVDTLDIQPGGIIDVSTNGFKGGNPNLGWNTETWGTDGQATTTGASTGMSGGSYGGLGGAVDGRPNALYGLSNAPAELGSGGSFEGGSNYGGNGGGRVDIEAGQLIVNGSILANGGYGSWGGGGSGGSIWLRIAGGDFQGSGLIQAQGGSPYGGGAGGGGRIAITAHAATNFTGTVSAGNGTICWQLEALPNPHLSLTIARIDVHTLLLGWPASPAGFILQQNPDLGPAHWTDVLAQPVDNGTNKQVILDAPSGTLFFRLRR